MIEQTDAEEGQSVPLGVRVMLARPAVQVIADDAGVDILHIKGAAVDPILRPMVAPGTDVDALVRPSQVLRLDDALRAHGWHVYSTFVHGSPFGHAQTYLHPTWGYFDLHRRFPGVRVDSTIAFELMWSERHDIALAGARGSVPSIEMQATLLILNAARSRTRHADPVRRWVDETGLDRGAVDICVDRLQAHVAFAAASGQLEGFRSERDYALWRVVSQGGSRADEWWARIRAADGLSEAIRIAMRAPLVNLEQLAHDLGRPPTKAEIAQAFVARPVRAVRELVRRHARVARR